MKCIMPRSHSGLQININFFLQTNYWISYINKSHFRSVERFGMHLRTADNFVSYHGLCWHQPRSQRFFPNAEQLIGFLQSIALRWERSTGNEVEWACIFAKFSDSTRTKSFQKIGIRESSSYIPKKNIQAEVKYKKIRISCQQKRCFM